VRFRLLPWINRAYDTLGALLLAWKAAAIILTIVTIIFSCLTVVASESQKCAGMKQFGKYLNQGIGFFMPAAFSVVVVVVYMLLARNTEARAREGLRILVAPVFEFRSIRISYGAFLIGAVHIGTLGCLALLTGVSVDQYSAIMNHCR
jgi:hypothetical protein